MLYAGIWRPEIIWESPREILVGKLEQEASKRPARGQQGPARGQQEASKKPARGQQEKPARGQEEARKTPQMGGTPRNTETIEKQPFS